MITLAGSDLASPTGLWTSFPAKVEFVAADDEATKNGKRLQCKVTVGRDVEPQLGGIRLATASGVSNLRPIMVDDLPSLAEKGDNGRFDTAQEITPPIAVDGAVAAESADYFAFDAAVGQPISIEAVSRRLGWPLDPVIRLLDADGRELAYSDDADGVGPDARLRYEFQAPGRHFIEVRDVRYRGGGAFRYRLRVSNFPLVSAAFPMGVATGAAIPVEAVTADSDQPALRRDVTPPDGWPRSRLPIAFAYTEGQGSGLLDVAVSELQPVVEFEPNDETTQGSPLGLPAALHGRIDSPGDVDYYTFEAKKGQSWRLAGVGRSFGSPVDLVLGVYKPDGTKLAEVDDSGRSEGELTVAIPADGSYHLKVEDLLGRGGAAFVYRVEATAASPGFRLVAESEQLNASRGGVAVVKVRAERRNFNGPITLALAGVEGVQLADNVIAKDKPETTMRITVPSQIEPGTWWATRIVGRAKISDQPLTAVARTTEALRQQLNRVPFPPGALDGEVALGVGPPFPEFFQLSVEPGTIEYPQLVGEVRFQVRAKRSAGFKGAIALAVDRLPDGLTAEVKPIPENQDAAQIVLRGPKALVQGQYHFRIVASAAHQNQPRRVELVEVPLRVVAPVALKTGTWKLSPGAKQTVKLTVIRRGHEKSVIQLDWRRLPPGIRLTGPERISDEAGEVELEVETLPTVRPGNYADLELLATAEVQGRRIAAATPVAIEVAAPDSSATATSDQQ